MISVLAQPGSDGTVILTEVNTDLQMRTDLYQLSKNEAEHLAADILGLVGGYPAHTGVQPNDVPTSRIVPGEMINIAPDRIVANKTLPTKEQVEAAIAFIGGLPAALPFPADSPILAMFDTATQNALINIIRHLHLDD